uniref:Uncharacterized protein n=1 Tax=Romanomermis culicivorax TaxID=13658 RepID=A0A915HJI8_ROMCU
MKKIWRSFFRRHFFPNRPLFRSSKAPKIENRPIFPLHFSIFATFRLFYEIAKFQLWSELCRR